MSSMSITKLLHRPKTMSLIVGLLTSTPFLTQRIFLLHIPMHVYFALFNLQFNNFNSTLHSMQPILMKYYPHSPSQPIYQNNGRETSPQFESVKAFFRKQALVSIHRGVLAAQSNTTVLQVDHQCYLISPRFALSTI